MRHAIALLILLLLPFRAEALSTLRASWYYATVSGQMANGKRFDARNPHIAAHRSLPFGTVLRVTNPKNGKSIRVTVEDRGPFVKGRSLDLSRAGAEELGFLNRGVALLEVTVLYRPSS